MKLSTSGNNRINNNLCFTADSQNWSSFTDTLLFILAWFHLWYISQTLRTKAQEPDLRLLLTFAISPSPSKEITKLLFSNRPQSYKVYSKSLIHVSQSTHHCSILDTFLFLYVCIVIPLFIDSLIIIIQSHLMNKKAQKHPWISLITVQMPISHSANRWGHSS